MVAKAKQDEDDVWEQIVRAFGVCPDEDSADSAQGEDSADLAKRAGGSDGDEDAACTGVEDR